MARTVRDQMTSDPVVLASTRTVTEAARRMRDDEVGAILVQEQGVVCGILTDRDIVVRMVAEERDVIGTTLGEICSEELQAVAPDADLDSVVVTMRDQAIRRMAVIEGDAAVGILSIGDLG